MSALRRIGDRERRARLAVRHRLAAGLGAGTCEDVTRTLVALHATDPAAVFLSVGARLADPAGTVERVEEALYGRPGTLVRMLAMRRTMFVVTRDAAPDVFAAAGRQIAVRERKNLLAYLADGGGWDERWLAAAEAEVEAALAEHGDSSGAELSRYVPRLREQVVVARGKPYEATQNVASRIIRTMAAEYRIERRRPAGSWLSSQFRWARAEPLPDRPVDRGPRGGRTVLARGVRPRQRGRPEVVDGLAARRGAQGARGDRRADRGAGRARPRRTSCPATTGRWSRRRPRPCCCPGSTRRRWAGSSATGTCRRSTGRRCSTRTGNVGPTVWWDGEVIGGWGQRADGTVVWRQLADRGARAAAAADEAAAALTARLAGVRITPRFRTPLERELSS